MSDFEKCINASDLIEWIIETDPDWCVGSVRCIIDHIDKMPSAQPETHDKRTKTHSCDLISRQAAIDAILAVTGNSSVRELYEHVQEHGLSDMWSGGVNAAIDIIIAVPSAQPDTEAEIQKMQDLEQAQMDKAYELGYEEGKVSAQPEIVRCKDCKHHDGIRCFRWNSTIITKFDDFCSRAERRTDG